MGQGGGYSPPACVLDGLVAMTKRYLVAYDIPGDATRVAVARTLSGYGTRVQWSLFECCLTGRELRRMLIALARLIDPDTDRVAVFECAAGGKPAVASYQDKPYGYWVP
jgi:CRISPR-associated protein Cas2